MKIEQLCDEVKHVRIAKCHSASTKKIMAQDFEKDSKSYAVYMEMKHFLPTGKGPIQARASPTNRIGTPDASSTGVNAGGMHETFKHHSNDEQEINQINKDHMSINLEASTR